MYHLSTFSECQDNNISESPLTNKMNRAPPLLLLISMYNVCQYIIIYKCFFDSNGAIPTTPPPEEENATFEAMTTRQQHQQHVQSSKEPYAKTIALQPWSCKAAIDVLRKALKECTARTAAVQRAKVAVDVLLEEETEALKECTLEVEKKAEALTRVKNNARQPPFVRPSVTNANHIVVRSGNN